MGSGYCVRELEWEREKVKRGKVRSERVCIWEREIEYECKEEERGEMSDGENRIRVGERELGKKWEMERERYM